MRIESETPASPFLAALATRVLVSDGAMGTVLRDRGVPADDCLERANLDRPAMVRQLHREYIAAGADLVQSNTFGANRVRLAAYGLEGRVADLNRRGVEIAREAIAIAGRPVFCAGDVGPLGQRLEPDVARQAFAAP